MLRRESDVIDRGMSVSDKERPRGRIKVAPRGIDPSSLTENRGLSGAFLFLTEVSGGTYMNMTVRWRNFDECKL